MEELEALVAQIEHLALKIQPSARAKLMRNIATELRRRNRNRIKANIEPDGNPMAKRQGDRFAFRRLRDGEELHHRPFRFFGENTEIATPAVLHIVVQKTEMNWYGSRANAGC